MFVLPCSQVSYPSLRRLCFCWDADRQTSVCSLGPILCGALAWGEGSGWMMCLRRAGGRGVRDLWRGFAYTMARIT